MAFGFVETALMMSTFIILVAYKLQVASGKFPRKEKEKEAETMQKKKKEEACPLALTLPG